MRISPFFVLCWILFIKFFSTFYVNILLITFEFKIAYYLRSLNF